MISIIICSIKDSFFQELKINILNTIGEVAYEIIKIDNLKEKWSIAKAYNFGFEKAKFNNLLFIHEDILFVQENWGEIFINELAKKNIGLIGLAGASYKSKFPSAFWHVPKDKISINIIQHYKNKKKELVNYGFNKNEGIVAVDGVFLGLKKRIGVNFDEKIKGFHCYDLAISLRILNKGYDIKVIDTILIEHFSIGTTDILFLKNYLKFHKKYKKIIKHNIVSSKELDIYSVEQFIKVCLSNRFFSFHLFIKSFILNPISEINKNYLKMGIVNLIKNK
jgi:hypothetical protein